MKNRFILIILVLFHQDPLWAENLKIEASSISIEKKNFTIFRNNVIAEDNKKQI